MKNMNLPRVNNHFAKYRWNLLLILSLCANIILLGSSMNMFATSENHGKMPVYSERQNYYFADKTHFSYSNKEEVNVWYLTDIFYTTNSRNEIWYSVGDVFLFAGFNFVVCFIVIVAVKSIILLNSTSIISHNMRRKLKR